MKSKKKKRKSLLKQVKKHHREISLAVTLLAFISLFSFIGTFAWFTSEDSVTNKFQGGKLIAEIDETFIPNEKWEPGENTEKEVRIKNTGEVPTFVRVSLYEFILNFEVDVTDQTGNGNLKTVEQSKAPEVDATDTDTWQAASDRKGTFKQNNNYYVANQAWLSNPKSGTDMFKFGGIRDTAPHKYISLNFPNNLKTYVDNTATSDYWLYSNGYFYYSRPLKPGEKSDELLKSLTLSDAIPNKYKGSLYKLKIYMDAHDVTEPVLGGWQLDKNDPAYTLLKNQIK